MVGSEALRNLSKSIAKRFLFSSCEVDDVSSASISSVVSSIGSNFLAKSRLSFVVSLGGWSSPRASAIQEIILASSSTSSTDCLWYDFVGKGISSGVFFTHYYHRLRNS